MQRNRVHSCNQSLLRSNRCNIKATSERRKMAKKALNELSEKEIIMLEEIGMLYELYPDAKPTYHFQDPAKEIPSIPRFKFRFWDIANRKYEYDLEIQGSVNNVFALDKYHTEQFTGMADNYGRDIYEGDIVEFTYRVGDLAWQDMDDVEAEKNMEMTGKRYKGVVEREPIGGVNLQISCGPPRSTHLIFPLAYLVGCEVVGNINQSPKVESA